MSVSDLNLLIGQLLPEPHAGLLSGILFGTKATMSRELYNALVATGTLHIIALSGTNITILTQIVAASFLWIFSRRITSLLTILTIAGFIWFVGPSPSVIRAAIMGCLALVATVWGRQVWAFWFWIIEVCSMLALYPPFITDISFQLSSLAALGMILFSGSKAELQNLKTVRTDNPAASLSVNRRSPTPFLILLYFLRNLFERIRSLIMVDLQTTLSAQVFTIPVILLHFHRISLISPVPNLLIVWILAPLTGLGLMTVVVALIFQPLGQLLAWITWVPLDYIIRVVMLTGSLPFASLGI